MVKSGGYLRMPTDRDASSRLLDADLREFGNAAKRLASDAIKLGSFGIGTSILEWAATVAAIYLLVLDRTNWKTNILTGLLIPYIFFSLPSIVFSFFRGQVGRWIAFVAVILRIFFPKHFPDWLERIADWLERIADWLELPAALIVLIVVAPSLIADTCRDDWVGIIVCLVIAGYLLQEHIRAAGGFKNSFTKANGISNTVGIIILIVYPIWALFIYFL